MFGPNIPFTFGRIGNWFCHTIGKKTVRDFLQKTELSAQNRISSEEGDIHYKLEDIGDAISAFLKSKGYDAINCELNMDYRYYKQGGKRQIERLKRMVELAQKNPNSPVLNALKTGSVNFFNRI